MSWFSVFKSQPHHEGRTYNDPNKLGRELSPNEVKENGEIFLLDAIKSMPHVEKRGNTVLIEPTWLKGMQPDSSLYGQGWKLGDRVFGFSFDFRDIHKESLCIEFYYQRASKRHEFHDVKQGFERVGDYLKARMCIAHRKVPDDVEGDEFFSATDYKRTATPADDYAAFVYMTSDKELFNSLWETSPVGRSMIDRIGRIIDDYSYKRLSDGRLQRISYGDLTPKEKEELMNELSKVVDYDVGTLQATIQGRMMSNSDSGRRIL